MLRNTSMPCFVPHSSAVSRMQILHFRRGSRPSAAGFGGFLLLCLVIVASLLVPSNGQKTEKEKLRERLRDFLKSSYFNRTNEQENPAQEYGGWVRFMLNKTLNNDEAENPTTSPTASELVDSRGFQGRVPEEMGLSPSDAWRTWEGVNENCDLSPKDNPCVTCSCKKVGHSMDGTDDYNACREETKFCHGRLPCAASVKKPGECCKSCPNGPNCSIYGTIRTPSERKFFKPGSDNKEYKVCGLQGVVKTCFISRQMDGWAIVTRTECFVENS